MLRNIDTDFSCESKLWKWKRTEEERCWILISQLCEGKQGEDACDMLILPWISDLLFPGAAAAAPAAAALGVVPTQFSVSASGLGRATSRQEKRTGLETWVWVGQLKLWAVVPGEFLPFILIEKKHLSWGAVTAVKLLYRSSRGPDVGSQRCEASQKRLYLQLQGIRCALLTSGWHCIHVHRNSTRMRAACIHMHTHTVKM